MPRTGPTYSLPEAAFVPNTTISSAAVNDDFSDIAEALTNSLARNGAGGMTGVLPLDNTGFNFLSDPDTGIYRAAANELVIKAGGTDVVGIDAAGIRVQGILQSFGDVKAGNATSANTVLTPVGQVVLWTTLSYPAGYLLADGSAVSRTTYAGLFAVIGTTYGPGNGTTTFNIPLINSISATLNYVIRAL